MVSTTKGLSTYRSLALSLSLSLSLALKEVFRSFALQLVGFSAPWCRIELQKLFRAVVFVHFENSGLIAAPVTVIGSAKDCDHLTIVRPVGCSSGGKHTGEEKIT